MQQWMSVISAYCKVIFLFLKQAVTESGFNSRLASLLFAAVLFHCFVVSYFRVRTDPGKSLKVNKFNC